MSTLALLGVVAAAPSANELPKKPSFLRRLLHTREKEARRRVETYLRMLPEERLLGLGFTPQEVRALRGQTNKHG